MSRVLEDQWDSLSAAVYRDAGPTQLTECRRAFYAGCAAMSSVLYNSPENEEEIEAFISGVMQEIEDFNEKLKNREAGY